MTNSKSLIGKNETVIGQNRTGRGQRGWSSLLCHAGKYRLDIQYRRPVQYLKRVNFQPAPALNLFDDHPMETDRIWSVRRPCRKDSWPRAAPFSPRLQLQEIVATLIESSRD